MVTARSFFLLSMAASSAACSSESPGPATPPAGGSAGAGVTAGAPGTGGVGGAGGTDATAGASGDATGGTGGGAGATGGGGAGGSGGEPAGPVLPVLRDGLWAFDLGDVTLEVDPMVAGRIATFRMGAENLLTGPAVNDIYWGSTLWTSPESQWSQPPPAEIDSAPYAVSMQGEQLVLTGSQYEPLGVSVTKTFSADPLRGAFDIEYKLTNHRQTQIQMAPWEVTRVFPRGLTFFPTGSTDRLSNGATLPTTKSDGITWHAYDMSEVTMNSKLFADGAEGWVAHVAQGLVFIKAFPDVPPAMIAPNEGDVELFVNAPATAAQRYIEIENQAAYGPIEPQGDVAWTVTWYLRRLPDGMNGTTPNAELAQFVRETIAAP